MTRVTGKDSGEHGFTLIEVLMSIVIFALLMAVVYGALGPAGEGFIQLQEHRDKLEKSHWLGRQLRMDLNYLSSSHDTKLSPIKVTNDNRGNTVFDELWVLSRESGQPSLSYIHYFIDEERGVLMRESRMAWARDSVDSMQWDLGDVESFDVEFLNTQGQWVQRWGEEKPFKWPLAARVKIKEVTGEREWTLPILVGQAAQ